MNWLLLYLLILKATLTSFNGPMSLPVLRDDFVVKHHLITDRELNAAVTTGQSAPGPMGIYVVSIGYFVGGIPGAFAGYLALLTPTFLMLPVLRWLGPGVDNPRVRGTMNAAIMASSGLILRSAIPLAQASITSWAPAVAAVAALLLVTTTRVATVWIIAGAGLFGASLVLLGGSL